VSILFPENAITIIRGSSKTLKLTVTDETDAKVNLTGARLYFSVKVSERDPQPLFQKSSNNSAQAEITVPREGIALIYLQPSDTQNLDPHEYLFDVWVVLANGKRYPVVKPSVFKVEPGISFIPL
jgi:hypothetical protein